MTVGTPELPPDTPVGADPVANGASLALQQHHALVLATRALTDAADRHADADAEVARLEARAAELTATTFDLARTGAATAEVELARSSVQTQLEQAGARRAVLALRKATAATALDELSQRYPATRLALATLVAARAGSEATRLDAAWAGAPDPRLDVVFAALAQVGDPYVWGAVGPDTFDCSGLTGFAWKAAGVDLPHYTVTQRQSTLDVAESSLRAGDLVFNLDGPDGGHVMLFLGLGHLVVHAPSPGRLVSVSEWRAVTGFGSPLRDGDDLGEPAAVSSAPSAPTGASTGASTGSSARSASSAPQAG